MTEFNARDPKSRNSSPNGAVTAERNCPLSVANDLIEKMWGLYGSTDLNNSDVLLSELANLLCEFPESVAREVCHPTKGLPRRSRFFPRVNELSEALDAAMAPYYREEKRRLDAEHFQQVAGYAPNRQQRRYYETLHDKFKHLNPTPPSEITDPVEKARVMASVEARHRETAAILKTKKNRNPGVEAALNSLVGDPPTAPVAPQQAAAPANNSETAMNGNEHEEFSEEDLAVRVDADRRLRDGWRDKRWDTTINPVTVSDRLRANLEAKAKPDYVPLGSGQGRPGDR